MRAAGDPARLFPSPPPRRWAINLLAWSVPLGRIFGIRVRVHLFLLILLAALLLQAGARDGLRGMGWQAVSELILFASILIHELAHCGAAVRAGAGAEEILLWPLGGLAYIGRTGSARDEIRVAAAGPLSNFLLGGVGLGTLALSGAPWSWDYLNPFAPWWDLPHLSLPQIFLLHGVRINFILGLFNLGVPAYPLDGGRILYAFLSTRMDRAGAAAVTGRVAVIVGAVLAAWGFAQGDFTLLLIGVWVVMEGFQILRLVRLGEMEAHPVFGTAGPEYAPGGEEPRPGLFARWRARRARRRAEREAREAEALERAVDAILEKVGREGIGSLTRRERRLLEEASRRRRS